MKDQVFTGTDVAAAVETASRALGVAPDQLRFVVLDREPAARIAILSVAGGRHREPVEAAPPATVAKDDPRAQIRALIRAIAETGGLDLSAEIEDGAGDRIIVRLGGADARFFLDNEAEVLKAVDHLLQRSFQEALRPSRLVIDCEGYRDWRDEQLKERALSLAASVRGDGKPRETEPLNSYERRIVHVTLTNAEGIRTFSVGEGPNRRVTVALAQDDGGSPAAD